MNRRVPIFAALALALGTVLPSTAWAGAPTPDPACLTRQKAEAAQSESDGAVVKAATAAFSQGGFAALERQLPALEQALARAPRILPTQTCDGATIVRANSPTEALVAGLMGAAKAGKGARVFVVGPTPYTTAALLIGSAAVERTDYPTALAALSRGLELAPTDPRLTTEAASALSQTGRPDEALKILDRTLEGDIGMPPVDRARLLRSRGYALGELKRYDEAAAAYRQSLALQPGHVGAQNELIYLARMKAGGAATQSVLMTTDKAATKSADAELADKMATKPK